MIVTKYFIDSIDKEYLNFINSYISKSESINTDETFKEHTKIISSQSVDTLKQQYHIRNQGRKDSSSFKKIYLTFIPQKVGKFHLLNSELSRRLLDLITQTSQFNSSIDEYQYYFRLTFDSNLSPNNYEVNQNNILGSLQHLKRTSDYIIKRIDKILECID